MRLVQIGDVIINVGAIADAEFDPAAAQAGEGPNVPPRPRLVIRFNGMTPGGMLLTKVYHGATAIAVRAYLVGLCESSVDLPA